MDFGALITSLAKINRELLEQSVRAVNVSLTLRNWFFGFHIVEFEQNGDNRAEYGKSLLASISAEMKVLGIPNTDERELRRCRQFYFVYPEAARFIASDAQSRGLPPSEFTNIHIDLFSNQIRGLPTPESNGNHIELFSNQIRGSATPN